jgi:16S rRNA (adenine1518-N6/adenine1519-N6)-dimethyltransferase
MNAQHGTRPRSRRLGQNFLVDRRAAQRIVGRLAPTSDEWLLEIGPGRGALTSHLIEATDRVVAVEIDERLAHALAQRHEPPRLLLIHADILDVELADIANRAGAPADARWVIAGNLPYSISKPVAMKLVAERERIARAVLMFQREVAQRLTARPGSRAYGPMTVLVGLAFQVEQLFDLAPTAFRPRPKVASSVTLWRPRPASPLSAELEPALRAVLRACFAQRRRTLRNNLRAALASPERCDELLELADLDGSLRAEAIPADGFIRLAQHWLR